MGTTNRAEELAKELSERLEGLCEGLAISGDSPSKETILNYFNELNNYRQSEIDELTKEVEHKNHTIENDAIHIETLTKEVERLMEFVGGFIHDFEMDYVMEDGRIVDNPSDLLVTHYEKAKALTTH